VFDDTNWKAQVTAFQQYLSDCTTALAVSRKGYTDASEHIDTDTAKAQESVKQTRKPAPVVSSAKYQARHVYLLQPSASVAPVDCNPVISLYRQPLWASMGEQESKRAA